MARMRVWLLSSLLKRRCHVRTPLVPRGLPWWAFPLLPLEFFFRSIAATRRTFYRIFPPKKIPVPVVVVGNITVGGTGKTPLVLALAQHLKAAGWRPGIVSRGFRGNYRTPFVLVNESTDAETVGDEPKLLFEHLGCPVVVARRRALAAQVAVQQGCTILLSDDGLQHYGLGRDIEIAVIDGARGLGNHHRLPLGPLREPESRLKTVNFVLENGKDFVVHLEAAEALNERSRRKALKEFQGQTVHAIAGTGHPQRFFSALRSAGLTVIEHVFPDHARFTSNDLAFGDGLAVLMTEKDAVKCERFILPNAWVVPCSVTVQKDVLERFETCLAKLGSFQKTYPHSVLMGTAHKFGPKDTRLLPCVENDANKFFCPNIFF